MRDAELPAGCRAQSTCQLCATGEPTATVISDRTRLGLACIALCGGCARLAGSWAELMSDAELRNRVAAHAEHVAAEEQRRAELQLAAEVESAQILAGLVDAAGGAAVVVIDESTVSVVQLVPEPTMLTRGVFPGPAASGE